MFYSQTRLVPLTYFNNNFLFRSRKWDLLKWMVTVYSNQSTCSGVMLSSDWLLTPSGCWKEYHGEELLYELGSFDKSTEDTKSLQVQNIVFYPGPLDISLIKVKDLNDSLINQHVFPCILSENGGAYAKQNKMSGILQAKIPSKSATSTKVRFRGLPLRIVQSNDPSCPNIKTDMFAKAPNGKDRDISRLVTKNAPFFAKVGRTRWSLAGFGVVSANQDAVGFELLAKAIDWMDDLVLNHGVYHL